MTASSRPNSPAATADRRARLAVLLLLPLALLWFWPTFTHGLRSDDFLVTYYTDRLSGAVRWDRVVAEFARPWFDAGELYRPLVSVSFGVELALCPSPSARHVVNTLLVAIAALATAATAGVLARAHGAGPKARVAAPLLAGLTVLLHPAAVETAAWLAARVTSLEMAFGALALWRYTKALASSQRSHGALALFALALLTKEGAVTLPATLLLADWLLLPTAPLRARVRRMLPYAALLAGYFALRLLVLGRIGSVDAPFALANLGNVGVRVGQLAAPPDADGWTSSSVPRLLALLLLPFAWRHKVAFVLLPLWAFAVLLPTQHLAADHTVFYGRFCFDALPGLGLVAAATLGHLARAGLPWWNALWLLWLTGLALTSRDWIGRYTTEAAQARAAAVEVDAFAAAASDERPVAIAGLPMLPVFHQKLWGVLGLSPFQARDLPVLGLPELLTPDDKAPRQAHDGAPIHALLAAGGRVGRYDQDRRLFVDVPPPGQGSLTLAADPSNPGAFVAAAGLSPAAFASVHVQAAADARTLELELLDDLPGPPAYGRKRLPATAGAASFATVHAVSPILLGSVGLPLRGVRVFVDGQPAPATTTVVVHRTLPTRALPAAPVAGAEHDRAFVHGLTRQPPSGERARFYLWLPTAPRWQDVPQGGAPMDALLQRELAWALDLFGPLVVHWWWQAPPDANTTPWRTPMDRALVR